MEITSVNSRTIVDNNWILKPNFHMNYGKKRIERAIRKKHSFLKLGEVVDSVFTGGIFKRVFVDNPEFGFSYISAQHMMNINPLDVAKCISKKYTPKLDEMTLKENQILVSCAGTIGNVKLITEDLVNVVGSQDIIRINADNNKLPYGYLYAYLSSKTAYNYMQSFIYGSVVPRIEPRTLSKLPIPILPENIQKEIHQLIVEASNLRVDANKLLKEVVELFENKLPEIKKRISYISTIKNRISHNSRFEATYDSEQIDSIYEYFSRKNIKLISVKDLSEKVFTPNIFKRIRANNIESGIPYYSGSELLNQFPNSKSYLSRKMPNIKNYILKNNWLAIQDAGTIGYISYVHEYLDGVSATNNLIRIVPSEDNWNTYIYVFFKTSIGQSLLKYLEFGSVQKHIDNHQISNLEIPIFDDIVDEIKDKTMSAMSKSALACKKENQAIDLIEKEIDGWQ